MKLYVDLFRKLVILLKEFDESIHKLFHLLLNKVEK